MKFKYLIDLFRITLICFGLFSFSQTSSFAQGEIKEVLAANEELTHSLVTRDSSRIFSVLSSDFKLIDGSRGNEWTADQFWAWWKGGIPLKAVGEVTSTKINGSMAWLTYHYTFTPDPDNVYPKTVNAVENYEDFQWIGTGIFEKENNKWTCVLWHTSKVPND